MRLTPPKKWVFWVSVVLAILSVILVFIAPSISVWVALAGYVLLALGVSMKGF